MKQILIVAYYFNDENMGAVRLRRIAKQLGRSDYEVTVLASSPRNPVVEKISNVHIERVESFDMTVVYEGLKKMISRPSSGTAAASSDNRPCTKNTRLSAWINRWLMLPDKQMPWIGPAVRRGRELIAADDYDLIYASLEPRSNLLVAAKLAKWSGIPCIMEYRDLWTGNPYYHLAQPTILHRYINRRLEHYALARAAGLVALSEGLKEALEKQAVNHGLETRLLYNFFDPDEYSRPAQCAPGEQPFTIIYTGAMYYSRHPGAFFRGLRMFIDAQGLKPGDIRFRWMGMTVGIPEIETVLSDLKLWDYIQCDGIVDHQSAILALQQSDIALVIQSPEDQVHIPGKLFEAFGARIPVLAVCSQCEMRGIIDEVGAGISVDYDPASIAEALREVWELSGNRGQWYCDEEMVGRYSSNTIMTELKTCIKDLSQDEDIGCQ